MHGDHVQHIHPEISPHVKCAILLQRLWHALSTLRERRDFLASEANENANWVLDAMAANTFSPGRQVCLRGCMCLYVCGHVRSCMCACVSVLMCTRIYFASESVICGANAHTTYIKTALDCVSVHMRQGRRHAHIHTQLYLCTPSLKQQLSTKSGDVDVRVKNEVRGWNRAL